MNDAISQLEIASVAYGGMGIARYENLVYFVPGTVPGENVSAKVTTRKKNYVIAEALEILSPSPDRVSPPCPYFDRCGGCVYMHINAPLQRALKKQQLIDILTRLGKLNAPQVENIRYAPNDLYYRNRITVHKRTALGGMIGFFSRDNQSIIPIEKCIIAQHGLNRMFTQIRNLTDIPSPFAEIVIACDAQRSVALFTSQHTKKHTSFYYFDGGFHTHECPPFSYTLNGITLEYNTNTFFQTNNAVLGILCKELCDTEFNGSEVLIDAYCGVGIFSLLLHKKFDTVIGIEENGHACEFAMRNASKNNIKNVPILNTHVEKELKNILRQHSSRSCTVLLDPPRTGLSGQIVTALLHALPQRLIYISCEPTTLARDLAALSSTYSIERVIPFDMFPHTHHIETLVVLRK
ncbi:MAG: class I SAM-dependent RNA methyltransferase [Candidatus Omnitrophica bacterium]|nr:class I SAM-dependent RNA methyltransferase [Candidatus Omnitrophota bacterium]